eukprot:g2501.t1
MSTKRKFLAFVPAQQSENEDETSSSSPVQKKKKIDSSLSNGDVSSSFGAQQLMKHGWSSGTGLGANSTGEITPVSASDQLGTRGLGFEFKNFEAAPGLVGTKQEHVEIKESIEWIPTCTLKPPTAKEIATWCTTPGFEGHALEDDQDVKDAACFCDKSSMNDVWAAKSIFDDVSPKEFVRARNRANPFEAIKSAIFCNRAAVKMSNMDAAFGFRFSRPPILYQDKEKKEKSSTSTSAQSEASLKGEEEKKVPTGTVWFADLCAGPGGFSEYMLWRRRWQARGFGFTLSSRKGGLDFRLEKFGDLAPTDTYDVHYGRDGTGDIYNTENMRCFSNFVLSQAKHAKQELRRYHEKKMNGVRKKKHKTELEQEQQEQEYGLDTVIADGGFGVEGRENLQEKLSRQILLCQLSLGMSILRPGGRLICKTFDNFLPFTVGCLYILYRCFEKVCIFKPVTSRPANSERYFVCEGLRSDVIIRDVVTYMWTINDRMNMLKGRNDRSTYTIIPKRNSISKKNNANLEPLGKRGESSSSSVGTAGRKKEEYRAIAASLQKEAMEKMGIEVGTAEKKKSSNEKGEEKSEKTEEDEKREERRQRHRVYQRDVNFPVPLDIMQNDKAFSSYVTKRNNRIASDQAEALRKIRSYIRDTTAAGEDQSAIRSQCFDAWGIPSIPGGRSALLDMLRKSYSSSNTGAVDIEHPFPIFQRFCEMDETEYLRLQPRRLLSGHVKGSKPWLRSVKDWMVVPMPADEASRKLIIGCGQHKPAAISSYLLHKTDKAAPDMWTELARSLPKNTLLEGVIIEEYFLDPNLNDNFGRRERQSALLILDVAYLGGMDVRKWSFPERMQAAACFVEALSGIGTSVGEEILPLRVNQPIPLSDVKHLLNEMEKRSGFLHVESSKTFHDAKYKLEWKAGGLQLVPVPAGSFRSCCAHKFFYAPPTKATAIDKDGNRAVTSSDIISMVSRFTGGGERGKKVSPSSSKKEKKRVERKEGEKTKTPLVKKNVVPYLNRKKEMKQEEEEEEEGEEEEEFESESDDDGDGRLSDLLTIPDLPLPK